MAFGCVPKAISREAHLRQAPGAVLSAHRAGSVKQGLWEIGRVVVDDLEAIVEGHPLPTVALQERGHIPSLADRQRILAVAKAGIAGSDDGGGWRLAK